jgi:hypothetical protein
MYGIQFWNNSSALVSFETAKENLVFLFRSKMVGTSKQIYTKILLFLEPKLSNLWLGFLFQPKFYITNAL